MNEDLHIEKAAQLADKPAAENLATDRAKKFVADALASKKEEKPVRFINIFERKPIYAWGGVAMAIAACVALAVILFRPAPGGVPGLLLENQDIHAETEAVSDTTGIESSDSLTVESIILPE